MPADKRRWGAFMDLARGLVYFKKVGEIDFGQA